MSWHPDGFGHQAGLYAEGNGMVSPFGDIRDLMIACDKITRDTKCGFPDFKSQLDLCIRAEDTLECIMKRLRERIGQ